VVVASGGAGGAAPRSVTDRLALYDAGKFQEAIQGFATVTDLLGAYEQLVAEGGTWILAAPADDQSRRRLVAASFALEVAAVRPALSDHDRGLGFTLGTGPITLVAWGAVALVQRVPAAPSLTRPSLTASRQAGELPWFQAAASLLQRGPTYRALIRQSEAAPLYRPATVFPLIETALARFPNDPELRLARAGAYQRSAVSSSIGGRLRPVPTMRSVLTSRGPGFGEAERGYRELITNEAVGAEARLRLGFIRFLKGDESEARAHFREADRLSGDADTKYAARLLTAWAWDVERRHDDALAAFRRALEIAPDAYSAAVPVAAGLQKAGRLAEAEALLQRSMVADYVQRDPLFRFDQADSRFFPQRIERLRETLKR
jgi:tetratricopeptide (TPR) repeat protein